MSKRIVILPTAGNLARLDEISRLVEEADCEPVLPPSEEAVVTEDDIDIEDDGQDDPVDGPDDDTADGEDPEQVAAQGSDSLEDDICIVVLADDFDDEDGVADELRSAVGRGMRCVGVWPPDHEDGVVPQAFEDFGSVTIPWDPGALKEFVTTGRTVWKTPDGIDRAPPITIRNRC